MKRVILIAVLIVINIIVIFYINFKIQTDLSYHSGKDGGFFTGLEMITIMSSIYFLVLSKKNKLIFFMVGLVIGVISYIASYFLTFYFLNSSNLYYYLMAMIIFILIFNFIEKKVTQSTHYDQ